MDVTYTVTYHTVNINPPHNILPHNILPNNALTKLPDQFFLITQIHNNKTKQNFYNVKKTDEKIIPANKNNVSQAEIDKYINDGNLLSNVPHFSTKINLNPALAPAGVKSNNQKKSEGGRRKTYRKNKKRKCTRRH